MNKTSRKDRKYISSDELGIILRLLHQQKTFNTRLNVRQ